MTVIQMTHHIVPLSYKVSDCKVEFANHSDLIVKSSSIVNLCQEEISWMLRIMLRCCHICRTKWDTKQPEKCFLQHDNVPSHMAMSMQQFLMEKQITLMPQPLYSPNLAHKSPSCHSHCIPQTLHTNHPHATATVFPRPCTQITLLPQSLYSPNLAHKSPSCHSHCIPYTLHTDFWWFLRQKILLFTVDVLGHLKLWMQHGSCPASCAKGGSLWVRASEAKLLEQVYMCAESD